MDYTIMAMESNLKMLDVIQEYEMTTMLEESEYIRACLECGFLIALEASNNDGVLFKLRDAFREFLDKIASLFRKKSVERAKKYKPWVLENKTKFVSMVDTIEPINLAPFWKGAYKEDNTKLVTAINKAYSNGKNGKVDYDFAKVFIKDVADVQEHAGTLPTHLKNYFKYGEIGLDAVEPVRTTGAELAKLLPTMIQYVLDYDTDAAALSDKIQQTINRNLDKIPANTTPASESLTADRFINIEGKPLCESSLATLINYQSVVEAKKENNDMESQKKEAEVERQEKEKDSNLEKANLKNETSVNISRSDDNSDKMNTDDTDKKDNASSETNSLVGYYKDLEYFFKLAYTAYQTSLEDRYVQYVNILLGVAKVSGKTPKFNEKGEYVKPKLVDDEDKVDTSAKTKNNERKKNNFFSLFRRAKKNE